MTSVFPLRDDVANHHRPWMVIALLFTNALVYTYELSLGAMGDGSAVVQIVHDWGLVPRDFLRGIGDRGATEHWVWLSPLTSMFLHAGPGHLLGNLLYLWIFGKSVEALLGPGRFLLFYGVCGLAAAAAHIAADPSSYIPTVGASGAVSGVLGGYLLCYPSARIEMLLPLGLFWPTLALPAVIFILVWFVIQLGAGLQSIGGVAWWGHVGGFVAGLVLIAPMRVRAPVRRRRVL